MRRPLTKSTAIFFIFLFINPITIPSVSSDDDPDVQDAETTTDADGDGTETTTDADGDDGAETSTAMAEVYDECKGFMSFFKVQCYIPDLSMWPLAHCFWRTPSAKYFKSWYNWRAYFDLRMWFPFRCYTAGKVARTIEYGALVVAMNVVYYAVTIFFEIFNQFFFYFFKLQSDIHDYLGNEDAFSTLAPEDTSFAVTSGGD